MNTDASEKEILSEANYVIYRNTYTHTDKYSLPPFSLPLPNS